jgi:hypothetical protein
MQAYSSTAYRLQHLERDGPLVVVGFLVDHGHGGMGYDGGGWQAGAPLHQVEQPPRQVGRQ